MDKHYWKNAYKDFWSVSAAKEKTVASLLKRDTGLDVIEIGLGAGLTSFITGNASENQCKKGDADLYIPQIDCYIEVTGPNIKMDAKADLWVRPDKLQNSYEKLENEEGKLHTLVHVLVQPTNEPLLRAIILDELFFEHLYQKKSFRMVQPFIRGRRETYYELPSDHETVLSWGSFLKRLPPC